MAWRLGQCPECAGTQLSVIALRRTDIPGPEMAWLRCVNCEAPLTSLNGALRPAAKPLSIPRGLPAVEATAWNEARECLAAGAYTAAVMMCRKLLLHVAVTHKLPEKDSRGRAPSFFEAIEYLEATGIITKRMRPWVDRIKDVGNDANHEISPVTRESALDVATFTEQLLRLAYEMSAIMDATAPTPDADV